MCKCAELACGGSILYILLGFTIHLRCSIYLLRCDASISKLSTDVSSDEQQRIRLQQEVTGLRFAVDVKLKEVEVKVRKSESVPFGSKRQLSSC